MCTKNFLFSVPCIEVYCVISEFPLLSDKFTAAKPVRKRRWGSTSGNQRPLLSVNISTDSLKVSVIVGHISISHKLYYYWYCCYCC